MTQSAAELRSHRAVVVDGREIGYALRRVRRRRHAHLVVDQETGLELRVPWRFSLRDADALVREHSHWILERLARRRSRPALRQGAELGLLGQCLRLDIHAGRQLALFPGDAPRDDTGERPLGLAGGWVWREGRRLCAEPGSGDLRALLEAWYRREARHRLPPRVRVLAGQVGARPARIQIRGQRTRWGSCSSRGTLSLNWRLLLVPAVLADYVLVHELCHLRHMDHSAAFWSLVESVLPDYRARRARLDALQGALPL